MVLASPLVTRGVGNVESLRGGVWMNPWNDEVLIRGFLKVILYAVIFVLGVLCGMMAR